MTCGILVIVALLIYTNCNNAIFFSYFKNACQYLITYICWASCGHDHTSLQKNSLVHKWKLKIACVFEWGNVKIGAARYHMVSQAGIGQ